MSGEFLKMKPGENIIEWSGNVTKLEIKINEMWL
jgi:phage-related protein